MPGDQRRDGWSALDPDPYDESDVPPWAIPGGIQPNRPPRPPGPARPVQQVGLAQAGDWDQRDDQGDDQRDDRPARGAAGRTAGQAGPGNGAREAAAGGRQPAVRGRAAGRSRSDVGRGRRLKRRLLSLAMALAVLAVAGGTYYYLQRPKPVISPDVTTLQHGEYAKVPDACEIASSAALAQILPGKITSIQPFADAAQSQCTSTVDAKPDFRVLNVTVQAYPPDLTVPLGNGNATTNARYTYGQQRQQLVSPTKKTQAPPATITTLTGLGDQALSAMQEFRIGSVIDRVTVLARYRNVLITVSLQAQQNDGFGPVPVTDLQAGALTVARAALARVKTEPAITSG